MALGSAGCPASSANDGHDYGPARGDILPPMPVGNAPLPAITETPDVSAEDYLERVRAILEPIRSAGPEIEAARQLPAHVVELMRSAGMFSVAVPKAMGGLELDPIAQFEAIELLAQADASASWCAMIGCDTGYVAAFLDDGVARQIFADPTRASAFVANPTGRAKECEGGYVVSGRWSFASGSTHSAVIALGCVVMSESGPKMLADDRPEMRAIVVQAPQARVIDTWTTTGVRGSGSHDVAVEDVFVPAAHTFPLFAFVPMREEPLYRFPMLFTFKLGAVAIGIARAAIDDVLAIAATKGTFGTRTKIAEQPWLQRAIADAEMAYGQGRAFYYEALRVAWAEMLAGGPPSPATHARLNIAQVGAVKRSIEVVDAMYKAGGSASLYATGTLDRRLRDIHTIGQHTVLSDNALAESAKALLGVAPGRGA